MRRFRRLTALLSAGTALTLILVAVLPVEAQAQTAAKIDLNTATQEELEKLPAVGEATAKKIIAGRPYKAVADLSKAGVPKATIEKITPLVTVGAPAAAAAKAAPAEKAPTTAAAPKKSEKINLNTATQEELETLKGVGPATAKKIIEGRPYASVKDLSKAGLSAKLIQEITPKVTVEKVASTPSPTASPVPSAPAQTPAPAQTGAAPKATETAKAPAVEARKPPVKGMVWVNTESKIFHREGDRWYGKTKEGKFMAEADAIKEGYRESKQ